MNPNLNIPIYIFTTKFGYYISLAIQYILKQNNISSIITFDINLSINNLYIILFSQKVKVYPKNYIIYQLEQYNISKWIDKKYKLSILFSHKTLDYSYANINKFDDILQKKITYFDIPCIPYEKLINYKFNEHIKYDVLFYGSMNDIRLQKINYLKHKLQNLNFKTYNSLYGEQLFKEIMRSKILINVHFYNKGLLETCRFNEALSCKKIIISLKSESYDEYNYNLYKNRVIFVDSLDEMVSKIHFYLFNNNEYISHVNNYKYYDNYSELIDILKKN